MSDGKILRIENAKQQIQAKDADLSSSTFEDVTLAGSTFSNVNLSGTTITDAAMENLTITEANLTGLKISDCNTNGMLINGVPVAELQAAYRATRAAQGPDSA